MKNFLFSIFIVVSFSSYSSATVNDIKLFYLFQEVLFKRIEANQIPSQVLKKASARYSGYSLNEVFVNENNEYKLVLKKNDKIINVYYKDTGDFIKEEAK